MSSATQRAVHVGPSWLDTKIIDGFVKQYRPVFKIQGSLLLKFTESLVPGFSDTQAKLRQTFSDVVIIVLATGLH